MQACGVAACAAGAARPLSAGRARVGRGLGAGWARVGRGLGGGAGGADGACVSVSVSVRLCVRGARAESQHSCHSEAQHSEAHLSLPRASMTEPCNAMIMPCHAMP